jgi:hypothetical protein
LGCFATQALIKSNASTVFNNRNLDCIGLELNWSRNKLPHYDDAFPFDVPIRDAFLEPNQKTADDDLILLRPSSSSSVLEGEGTSDGNDDLIDPYIRRTQSDVGDSSKRRVSRTAIMYRSQTSMMTHHLSVTEAEVLSVNEEQLRHGFLNFFVAVLKNYKRFLIYASRERPNPANAFRKEAFLAEHPSDWRAFLSGLVESQTFSQFVDERVGRVQSSQGSGPLPSDIVFFDESIDAKINRSGIMSLVGPIDTPFLKTTCSNHIKTYVPPSPDTSDLEGKIPVGGFMYLSFPTIKPELLTKYRDGNINNAFENTVRGQALAATASQARLKRVNLEPTFEDLSSAACHFSCYLTVLSHLIINSTTPLRRVLRPSISLDTQQALLVSSAQRIFDES